MKRFLRLEQYKPGNANKGPVFVPPTTPTDPTNPTDPTPTPTTPLSNIVLTRVNDQRRVRIDFNQATQPPAPTPFSTLVFEDHFTNPTLDTSKWTFRIGDWGADPEQQYYTNVNHSIANSILTITAKYEPSGPGAGVSRPYTSTRIATEDKAYFRYGRFEARIRCDLAAGVWPAFWLLGNDNTVTPGGSGVYPYQGEIDIIELISTNPQNVYANIHYWTGVNGNNSASSGSGPKPTGLDLIGGGFHIYAIEWDETEIRWFYDNILYHTESIVSSRFPPSTYAPFQKEFFIILNLAVGGWGGTPASGQYPAKMEIDYVRVYQ